MSEFSKTAVRLCNLALYKIGHDEGISSLDAGSKVAKICASLYEHEKEVLLRRYPWRFALQSIKLNKFSAKIVTVSDQTMNVFNYPSEIMRIWKTVPAGISYKPANMPDIGKVILAEVADLTVEAVVKASESDFDAQFEDALVCKMAAELALPIAQSASMKERLSLDYNEAIRDAKTTNAIETGYQQQVVVQAGWLDARLMS